MPILNWITDDDLQNEVSRLLNVGQQAYKKKQTVKEFNKNIVDPFSALFTMAGFELTYKDWHTSEIVRQAQKTLQNQVGNFHENILNKVDGWELVGNKSTFDLINKKRQIIAEVKNKHNTVKKSDLVNLHASLYELVSNKSSVYSGYTAYYVAILPPRGKRYDIPFETSNNKTGKKTISSEQVRTIDGASFYELVTGEKDAILQLYKAIVNILRTKGYSERELNNINQYFLQAFQINN
jgi:hypothetical protein